MSLGNCNQCLSRIGLFTVNKAFQYGPNMRQCIISYRCKGYEGTGELHVPVCDKCISVLDKSKILENIVEDASFISLKKAFPEIEFLEIYEERPGH